MEKIKLMNDLFLQARLQKNDVAKNLFSALKGEFENGVKNGMDNTDESLLKIVKKFVKGLEMVKTEKAKQELSLLDPFMPKVDIAMIEKTVDSIITPELIAEIKATPAKVGKATGLCMKALGPVDAKLVLELINKKING